MVGTVVVVVVDVDVLVVVADAALTGSDVAVGSTAEAHHPNDRAPTSRPPATTTTALKEREVTDPVQAIEMSGKSDVSS